MSYPQAVFPIVLLMSFSLGVIHPPVLNAEDEPVTSTSQHPLNLTDCLILPAVGKYGRSPVFIDPVEAALIAGKWLPPKAGDVVTLPDGSTKKWEAFKANKDGTFPRAATARGYAYVAVPSSLSKVMILEASGHDMVYVNGEPRAGDTYGNGYVHLPVLLRRGENHFLFALSRGTVRAKLVATKGEVALDVSDTTLPDLVVDEEVKTWGALVVVNSSSKPTAGLQLRVASDGLTSTATAVPTIPPLSTRKVGFRIEGPALRKSGDCQLQIKLLRTPDKNKEEAAKVLDESSLRVGVRKPEETRKHTFVSEIDGSVQYFAHVPAREPNGAQAVGLVLTLHGAGVEAIGQAACYSPKPNLHIVAPTNRRPYGFDWEDWGRLDAIEVLDLAQKKFATAPHLTYLTGHSMGGHGTWHLGVTFPDRFAAIAPSAGWVSMWSYAGARRPENPDAVQEILLRAASPSDTLALLRNTATQGIYILHGDKDDNVPVDQARIMRKQLNDFHPDLAYREQPGAGHWWGNGCVDWPQIFEFFSHHLLPLRREVRQVDFVTASPGISAWSQWAGIEAQQHSFKPSSVQLTFDPEKRIFAGTTENVARLALDLGHLNGDKPIQVELDGQKFADLVLPAVLKESSPRIWFVRNDKTWTLSEAPAPALKGPHRCGPFRDAFRNRIQFVYATNGNPEENRWAFAKARFDSETFWYRGNGSVDIVPDHAFKPDAELDRNVILYGSADTNRAWKSLLGDSPVQVHRGRVVVGDRVERGTDLACLFIRPRPGSDRACVGAICGTGITGMRLTNRLPIFLSGVGYPDCVILDSTMPEKGAGGVRAAGFFGIDWSVTAGEFKWRE